ncbi:hypothetical protein, partial [Klebsiella pneumoniae]|uniref:hypothetical protein n=1 Tax=Klebsiella pneumoniae TaxID=573 RepID=UPI00272F3FE0
GSALRYRLVGSDFDALNARGTASSLGLEASYPLIRSRERNLSLQGVYENKRLRNKANGADISNYKSDLLTLALLGNQ